MKSVWYRLLVFDRPMKWSLLGILSIRIIQFIYLPQDYFTGFGDAIGGFMAITSVDWAMYTFIPLAIYCMSGLIDIPNEPYPLTRTRDREDIMFRCLVLIVLKAAVFAAAVLLSGLALSTLRLPFDDSGPFLFLVSVYFAIVCTLFVIVCGTLLLCVNVLTGSLALAVAGVLLYSAWDYIAARTPSLLDPTFWWGWNLFMASVGGEASALLFGSVRLLMLAVLIMCVLLFCVRRKDAIHMKRETK